MILAVVLSTAIFPFVLRFAKKHDIVDNPDARKLQRQPVPLMGGVVAYASIVVSIIAMWCFYRFDFPKTMMVSMTIMMLIGLWDDIRNISATLRFLLEIGLIWAMMSVSKYYVFDLNGLWNIYQLNPLIAVPLSIFAGVGILNAVNLVDGVDGYCSGYGIVSFVLFGVFFLRIGDIPTGSISLICAGAIVPFFFHNVFGIKTKMFLGDSGSLMIGAIMAYFIFVILSDNPAYHHLVSNGMGLVAFCLAVMAIPVFDTLRVMAVRILRGFSPFSPDRTHLHHLFISAGFSHAGTAFSCTALNLLVVAVWYLSYRLGASIDWQLYLVVAMGLLVTVFFYPFMRRQQSRDTAFYHFFARIGALTYRTDRRLASALQHLVDDIFA